MVPLKGEGQSAHGIGPTRHRVDVAGTAARRYGATDGGDVSPRWHRELEARGRGILPVRRLFATLAAQLAGKATFQVAGNTTVRTQATRPDGGEYALG